MFPHPFTKEEESVLFDRLENCSDLERKKIRNQLVLHNMRFVVYFLKKHFSALDIPMEDLIQEGCLALYKALDTYKKDKGSKRFITWAKWWIRAYMYDYVSDKHLTIRIPSTLLMKMRQFAKIKAAAAPEDDLVQVSKNLGRGEEESKRILEGYSKPTSLSIKVYDSRTELIDIIADEKAENQEELLDTAYNKKILDKLMKELNKKERYILKLRWGMATFCKEEQTFEEVGKKLGISKQRVHQVESTAFKKMKESPLFQKLSRENKILAEM